MDYGEQFFSSFSDFGASVYYDIILMNFLIIKFFYNNNYKSFYFILKNIINYFFWINFYLNMKKEIRENSFTGN